MHFPNPISLHSERFLSNILEWLESTEDTIFNPKSTSTYFLITATTTFSGNKSYYFVYNTNNKYLMKWWSKKATFMVNIILIIGKKRGWKIASSYYHLPS